MEETAAPEVASSYLPKVEAAKVVSVTNAGPAMAVVVVQTQAVAVKETGPMETVARFGEVYAFRRRSLLSIATNRPLIRIWNLQPDNQHDFMLMDPQYNVLMKVALPPLKETAFVFTFHKEGLFDFVCAMHRPEMNGQILVLPARPQ
jgi:hypothetical protein